MNNIPYIHEVGSRAAKRFRTKKAATEIINTLHGMGLPELRINHVNELILFAEQPIQFIRQRIKKEYLIYSVLVRPEFERVICLLLSNRSCIDGFNELVIKDNLIQFNPETFRDNMVVLESGVNMVKYQVIDN